MLTAHNTEITARQEWRKYWPLVLAASIGISFHSFMSVALGLFMEPLGDAFGWSRTQITIGSTIGAVFAFFLSPPVGALIDKWGSRRIAIPGLIATSAMIASFGLSNGSMPFWIALWTMWALCSLAIKSTVWSTAVSGVFSTSRGLALGVTLSGTALAQVIVPPLGNWLITEFGWRAAYAWLGLGWGAVALILSFFFLYDIHDHRKAAAHDRNAQTPAELYGLTIQQAWRDSSLWRIALATLLTLSITIAVVAHQFPILTDTGMTRADAAWVGSAVGVAGIAGKLITGWLLDRYHARWIGGFTLSVTALFYPLLIKGAASTPLIITAMLVSGFAAGTKIQICNYLTTRYAGMKNFGAVFGFMASIIALAGGLGPVIGAMIFDKTGSYTLLLWGGAAASLISGALIFSLGKYPEWGQTAHSR